MTAVNAIDSMRFSPQEVVSGMLATLPGEDFTDEGGALRTAFGKVAGQFPLFSAFSAESAVTSALTALETSGVLGRTSGRYLLSAPGRAKCVNSKRMLFNQAHIEQLEGAALIFTLA